MASIFWWSVPVTLWIYFMIRFMQRLVNDLIDGTDNDISFAKNVIGLSGIVRKIDVRFSERLLLKLENDEVGCTMF